MRYTGRRYRRPCGFSPKPLRPVWNAIGLRGHRKRRVFNDICTQFTCWLTFAVWLITTAVVWHEYGFAWGLIAGFVAAGLVLAVVTQLLVDNRFWRP